MASSDDPHLSDPFDVFFQVDGFDSLRADELTVRQLEEIVGPIENLDIAIIALFSPKTYSSSGLSLILNSVVILINPTWFSWISEPRFIVTPQQASVEP
ncbi:hypothetical protein WICPIJ_005700 [Wickerhamomyces pijperi]|uniref:Uncharacterized protein n=1 Tax=Wickerhamomyces pijperi TaxID=599730 RepID=A0A9P8Q3G9_WICPI|nr:hypothetical protein WICPIJ_005700 [Wickerhamomyces pijperi]